LGVGGLAIDECRVGGIDTIQVTGGAIDGSGWGTKGGAIAGSDSTTQPPKVITPTHFKPHGPAAGGKPDVMAKDGMQMDEITAASGIDAPPLGRSMAVGASNRRLAHGRPEAELAKATQGTSPATMKPPLQQRFGKSTVKPPSTVGDLSDGSVSALESVCPDCGGLLDEEGCPECALLETMADDYSVKTDKGGHFTSDGTKKGKGELSDSVKGADTKASKPSEASDGVTTDMGKGKKLNPKQQNTGGTFEPLKGGSKGMAENISKLAMAVKNAISEGAKRIGRIGKYGVRFNVRCEGITQRPKANLAEALTDAEELIQVFGPQKVVVEAVFFQPRGKVVLTRPVEIPAIKLRDPVVCENRVVFRHPEVANDFADQVVQEGVTCRVKQHNWGATVVGQFGWDTAKRAFSAIQEARHPFVQE
jgi:hypothetical protein